MPEHKFDPFDRVLARCDDRDEWNADLFSHYGHCGKSFPFQCVGEQWTQCIPYTTETAHLLGTTQPYEPPKPPHEYKWGDRIEAQRSDGEWHEAVFLSRDSDVEDLCIVTIKDVGTATMDQERIRPLGASQ